MSLRSNGGRGGTRTLKEINPADFKSAAYTNSATRPYSCHMAAFRSISEASLGYASFTRLIFDILEAPTGIEPVYAVLQTAA